MKKIMLLALLTSLSGLTADVKIATINFQKVLNTVKEGVRATAKLKQSFERKRKSLKDQEKSLMTKRKNLEKKASLLSQTAIAKQSKELQSGFMKFQQETMKSQQEIAKLESEYKKPIFEKIKVIVDEISKKENVDMTIETSQTPVVYAKSELDITDQVIKKYDSVHK